MGDTHLGILLRHLRRLAAGGRADLTDRELVERFLRQADDAAFQDIVDRYGALVWSVCWRVLQHRQDAEDAFQATFMVLAHKAASVRKLNALGPWLYGVAYRVAAKARRRAARRAARERQAVRGRAPDPLTEMTARELCAALDEELQRLPERLRVPLVLCYLERKPRDEAARQLGWSLGTLKRRLERGRHLLGARLRRRGLTLSVGLLSAAVSDAAQALPAVLRATTTKRALAFVAGPPYSGPMPTRCASLARGVLMTMILSKVSIALTVAVALFVAGMGVAVCTRAAQQDTPAAAPADEGRPSEKKSNTPEVPTQAKRVRTDRLGDSLPEHALARLGTVRFVHPGHVEVLAFSPDRRTLASAGYGPTVCLWDPATGKLKAILKGHQDAACALSWSRDGKILASGSFDGTARLWDPATGKTLHLLQTDDGPFPVRSVCLSPDGKLVATGNHMIRFWDTATGNLVRALQVQRAHALSWSPDGKVLASGDAKTVRLWEPVSGKSLGALKGHEQDINSVCWSHSGKVLASASSDQTVRLWDRAGGGLLRVLKGHRPRGPIDVVAWSPDDKTLIGGSWFSRLPVWDFASGKLLPSLNKFQVKALSWSDDGSTVALADDQKIQLLDPATHKLKEFADFADMHSSSVSSLALSPDGKVLASASDSSIRLWNTDSGKSVRLVKRKFAQGHHLAWSCDGKVLASDGINATIGLWDPAGGEARHIQWAVDHLTALSWSRDNKVLAAAGWDKGPSIALWDTHSGKPRRILKGHTGAVYSLSWAPDGELLASASHDKTVRIWDTVRGTTMHVLWHAAGVSTVAWSGDGKVLASGGGETVRLWDSVTGRLLRVFEEPGSVWPGGSVSWSPDSTVLASATHDGTIRLRERATGQLIRVLERHRGPVRAIAFSPDGRRLYSGSADTTVLVWDVTGLEAAGPPPKDLPAAAIDAMWQDLGTEARVAHPAIWKLAAGSDGAVRFLKARLRAVAAVEPKRLARLVAQLDSERFALRRQAELELEALAELAAPALRQALNAQPAIELRRRLERLLQHLEEPPPPERLRQLRSIAVLEHAGGAEARQLLQVLSLGVPEAHLTQEARAALDRMIPK